MHILHFPVFFLTRTGIGKPVGVEYLSDESGCQEFGDLFAYGPTPFIIETTQALLGRL